MTLLLIGAAAIAIVLTDQGYADAPQRLRAFAIERPLPVLGATAAFVLFAWAIWTGFAAYPWQLAANLCAGRPRAMAAPWVIDGDTIDDLRTGARYRLANIDAPETGNHARCHYERTRGEEAKRVAIMLVRSAAHVTVRKTWRVDRYRRRVAYVLIDGDDLGELLMRRGLARPWRGRRRRWCGKNGGLAAMARLTQAQHHCRKCGA